MFKWRNMFAYMKSMNGYIAFGFILFFAGIVVGATNSSLHGYLGGQLSALQELATTLNESSEDPTLSFMTFIFINNAVKSVMIIYLGVFFGVFPIFFLVVNGMIIGYMLYLIQMQHGAGYVFDVIVRGLLPHGILEIPAIVIASAYGLKLGVLVWKRLFQFNKREEAKENLKQFLPKTLPVAVFLIVALLVASIIESTITPWLLSM